MAWVWVLGCNIRSCFDFPPRKGAFERGVRQAPLDRRPRRRVTPAPRHVAPERINVGCVVVVVGGRVPPYPWVRGQRRRRQHRSATEGDDVARYEDLARRAHRIEDVLGGLGQLGLDDGVVALGARRSVAGQGEADQSIREPRDQAVLVLVARPCQILMMLLPWLVHSTARIFASGFNDHVYASQSPGRSPRAGFPKE